VIEWGHKNKIVFMGGPVLPYMYRGWWKCHYDKYKENLITQE